jgi:hypothetical protein
LGNTITHALTHVICRTHARSNAQTDRPYHPQPRGSGGRQLALLADERVLEVEWQLLPGKVVMAFARTTQRLLLLDFELRVLAAVTCLVASVVWFETVVLFTALDSATVEYLCVNADRGVLVATGESGATLCAAMPSRLLFVAQSISFAQMRSVPIWPLECLVRGALAMQQFHRTVLGGGSSASYSLFDAVDFLTSQLDCSRASSALVQRLQRAQLRHHAAGLAALCPALDAGVRLSALMEDGRLAECEELLRLNEHLRTADVTAALAKLPADAAASSTPAHFAPSSKGPDSVDGWFPQKLDLFRGAGAYSAFALDAELSPEQPRKPVLAVPLGFVMPNLKPLLLPNLCVDTLCSTHLVRRGGLSAVASARLPPPSPSLPERPDGAPSAPLHLTVDDDSADSDETTEEEEQSQASPELTKSMLRNTDRSPLAAAMALRESQADPELTHSMLMRSNSSVMTRQESSLEISRSSLPRGASGLLGRSTRDSIMSAGPFGRHSALTAGEREAQSADDRLASRAADHLRCALMALEAFDGFAEGLVQCDAAMECLRQVSRPTDYQDQFDHCARFKLALSLLSRMAQVQAADPQSPEISRLMTLAAAVPLEADINFMLLREAIRLNMAVGNNRTAMLLLFHALKVYPNEQASLMLEVSKCEASGADTDRHQWCESFDLHLLVFCWQTFRIITPFDTCLRCQCCSGPRSLSALLCSVPLV